MNRLLAIARRLLAACVLGMLASVLLPAAAQAATCAPAATQGTAPADFRTYCWFDFSTYSDTTARSASGQNFTFNLPDGTTVTFNLKASGNNPALTAVAVPSWSGSAFGNSAFLNIPGKPILYTAANATTINVTLSALTVTPPSGGSSAYSIIVGDGESTNSGESLTFATNGNAWTRIATIQNGTSTTYPTVSGEGTKTVTETGVAGTVGSFVWRSDGNPTQVTSKLVAGGLQGIIIGMRYASISVVSQIANMRYNAADQFNYMVKTTGGTLLGPAPGATSGTALNGFTPFSVPTVAASYPFVVSESMASGSVGTLANYTTTLTCTNANAGSSTVLPNNQPVTSYTFPSLQYGDALLCTFTNTPIFNTIIGTVYNDANHNGSQDGSEAGTGLSTLYVKQVPVSGGACTGPATQAVAVDPATGAYTLPNLPQGTYCVVLDTNNTLSDITSTPPPGWLPTQNPTGVTQVVVPAGSPQPVPQNFGLFNGSRLTGTVFADTGAGAGTANNGVKDGGETGLAGVTVATSSGSVAGTVTAGDGTFTLWVPASVSGTLTITPTAPSGDLATGGSAGTTGGSYTRPSVSFTPAAGQNYSGLAFGLAPPSTFSPNGAQTAQPGTVVFYAHTFQAGSGGQVSFSLANASNPASPGWNSVLYQDSNCNATLDAGEPVIGGAITVTAGQPVCLIVKQFVPAGVAYGASNTATVTASFSYTNANPALAATLIVTDVTTAGEPSALSLQKLVSNLSRGGGTSTSVTASPGEVLQYTLTAQNNGGTTLSTLVINDATPAFTTFVSAACPGTLPAGITACSVSTQPGVGSAGSLQWTFTGSLASGAQLAVTYQVKLSQ
ncbi:MAG: DUF11 domain-containing protein [Burkholderiales bacterium]|nr:DUF11 domain-containing protein [Burkholderiales bacterium]